uniref:Uncharacterized protein n=1 Tax=Cucumis sativus TaxID=3659 RepID=A0A0A0LWD6_CUCSA
MGRDYNYCIKRFVICPYGVRVKGVGAARVCTNTFLQTEDPSSKKIVPWSFRRNRDTPIFVIFFLKKRNSLFSCSSIFNLQGIVEF